MGQTSEVNPSDWQARFRQQTRWTSAVRRYLYPRLGLGHTARVLEVGCGPGAILDDLRQSTTASIQGLDIRFDFLRLAQSTAPTSPLTCGNALTLPYADGSFDVTLCHYLLLWLSNPGQALAEMRRVTRLGGFVAALAEPDYPARIDYPDELAALGRLQSQSLASQGADPSIGKRLLALFQEAGLQEVQAGLVGGEWGQPVNPDFLQSEWAVLEQDLKGHITREEFFRLRQVDRSAWEQGTRILYVPTFYAWGRG